jgi:hypothetical protein
VTARQLALCDPTWPDPDDDSEWITRASRTHHDPNLWGQGITAAQANTITDIPLTGNYL